MTKKSVPPPAPPPVTAKDLVNAKADVHADLAAIAKNLEGLTAVVNGLPQQPAAAQEALQRMLNQALENAGDALHALQDSQKSAAAASADTQALKDIQKSLVELAKAIDALPDQLKEKLGTSLPTENEFGFLSKTLGPTPQRGPSTAPAAAPAPSVPKPLGDYIPCLFASSDDVRLRSEDVERGLVDGLLRAELDRQWTLGRLKPTDPTVDPRSDENTVFSVLSGADPSRWADLIVPLQDRAIHPATKVETPQQAVAAVQAGLKDAAVTASKQVSDLTAAATVDVGCSQSLLSWEEARDIFGKRIADTYLVIQVVVRNLNADKQFMMHDVQIALDSYALPMRPQFGDSGLDRTRFVGGRDKVLARGVAVAGQTMGARNYAVRLVEAIGALASAGEIVFTHHDFTNGVSIFQTAFIPGLRSVYPDLTIDQLNRLNDTGFSASGAYQIVVPKLGSVPFVTFLPTKIFAGRPTQDNCSQTDCTAKYKDWTQGDMLKLQEALYVVFAGVHITEDAKKPTLTKLDCPVDKDGYLDLSKKTTDKDKNEILSCSVTGTGLQAGSTVSLHSTDSTDTKTIDAPISVASDTAGTVALPEKDLDAAKSPNYEVYLATKDQSQDIKQVVKLRPELTAPATLDLTKCKDSACTFSVTGTNLGLLNAVQLQSPSKAPINADVGSPIGTFNVDKPSAGTYSIWINVGGKEVDSEQTLTVK